jgi:hypothetical protein
MLARRARVLEAWPWEENQGRYDKWPFLRLDRLARFEYPTDGEDLTDVAVVGETGQIP